MNYNIIEVEGIGPVYAEKLEAAGIKTSGDLLERGKNAKGRKEIAATTGISGKRILTWVNHVDLYRINGVGPQFAELLEASGVDTVTEFALRNPSNLEKKMKKVNEEKHLTRRVPSVKELEKMIAEARELPRVMTYGSVKKIKDKTTSLPEKKEKLVSPEPQNIKTVNIYEDDDVRIVDFRQYDDGKWGLKDEHGNWVEVESQKYDWDNHETLMVSKFDDAEKWEDLIILREGEDWGIIDRDGEWICSNFGGFEDEGYPYLIGWHDGDEHHIYPDGTIRFAFEDEDEEEDWEDDDWEDDDWEDD